MWRLERALTRLRLLTEEHHRFPASTGSTSSTSQVNSAVERCCTFTVSPHKFHVVCRAESWMRSDEFGGGVILRATYLGSPLQSARTEAEAPVDEAGTGSSSG